MTVALRSACLVVAATLLLGACGSNQNPLRITRTDCPAVAVVKNANTLTRFRGAGRNVEDILWTANLDGVVDRCTEGRTAITNQVSVRVGAQRASAGPAESITVPVFAAAVRGSTTLIAKDVKLVTISFAENALRGSATHSFSTTITDLEKAREGKFEVLIGFQLTSDEALYNIVR